MHDFHRRPKDRPSVRSERQVRFFKTVAGPGSTAYPSAGAVVYGQLLRDLTFDKSLGSAVSIGAATDQYDFLGCPNGNLPAEGAIVAAEKLGNRWFIQGDSSGVVASFESLAGSTLITCLDAQQGQAVACRICPCSADPWFLQFPSFGCHDAYGTYVLAGNVPVYFTGADGAGKNCFWKSQPIVTPAHTYVWTLTFSEMYVGDITGTIDLVQDGTTILTWTADKICCTCETCFQVQCNVQFPLPCPNWPAEICLAVGTCAGELLTDIASGNCCGWLCPYQVPLGWANDLIGQAPISPFGFGPGPRGEALVNGPAILENQRNANGPSCTWAWGVAQFFPSGEPWWSITATLTLPCREIDDVTLTIFVSSIGGYGTLVYTLPAPYWDCNGDNTLTQTGGDTGSFVPLMLSFFGSTLTLSPAQFMEVGGQIVRSPQGNALTCQPGYPCTPGGPCQCCYNLEVNPNPPFYGWSGIVSTTCPEVLVDGVPDACGNVVLPSGSLADINAAGYQVGNIYCFTVLAETPS